MYLLELEVIVNDSVVLYFDQLQSDVRVSTLLAC